MRPYYFFGKDETFALRCAIPFRLNSRQMTAWMVEGNGLKLMREFYRNYNIVNFPGGNTGAQMGGWYRKEIKSVADVKGLKMRIGGFAGRARAHGRCAAEHPRRRDLLLTGEGHHRRRRWVGPYDDQKLGFNKVAPNYYHPAGGKAVRSSTSTSTPRPMASLTPEYKAILEAAT